MTDVLDAPTLTDDVARCFDALAANGAVRARGGEIRTVAASWDGDDLVVNIDHAVVGHVRLRLVDVCLSGPELGTLGAGDGDDSGVVREWAAHLVEAGTWDVQLDPPVVVATHCSVFGPRHVAVSATALNVDVA